MGVAPTRTAPQRAAACSRRRGQEQRRAGRPRAPRAPLERRPAGDSRPSGAAAATPCSGRRPPARRGGRRKQAVARGARVYVNCVSILLSPVDPACTKPLRAAPQRFLPAVAPAMRPWARAARLCPLVLVLCASACTTRAQAPPQPAPTPAAPCAAGLRQATFRSTLRAAEGLTVVLTLCPGEVRCAWRRPGSVLAGRAARGARCFSNCTLQRAETIRPPNAAPPRALRGAARGRGARVVVVWVTRARWAPGNARWAPPQPARALPRAASRLRARARVLFWCPLPVRPAPRHRARRRRAVGLCPPHAAVG